MEEKTKYYLLKQKAVPEVLLKVAEAKKLIASEKAMTIQEATDQLGISRSSFYKYKDDIFPFYDNAKGKTITMVLQMDDERFRCRSRTNRDFCRMCFRSLHNLVQIF